MRKDPSDPSRSTPDSESAEGEKIGLPSNSPSLPRHPKFLLLQRHTRRSDQFAPGPDRCTMDRLHKISAEIIRLYRQQLNLWVLGRIADLKDADLLQCDRRRERLEQLGKELETLAERRG